MLSFSGTAIVREADWFVFKFADSLKYRSLASSDSESEQLPSIFCNIFAQPDVSISLLYAELRNTAWNKTMLLNIINAQIRRTIQLRSDSACKGINGRGYQSPDSDLTPCQLFS